jgi:hypothetical protein
MSKDQEEDEGLCLALYSLMEEGLARMQFRRRSQRVVLLMTDPFKLAER